MELEELNKSIEGLPNYKQESDIHKRAEIIAKKKKVNIMKDYLQKEHVSSLFLIIYVSSSLAMLVRIILRIKN